MIRRLSGSWSATLCLYAISCIAVAADTDLEEKFEPAELKRVLLTQEDVDPYRLSSQVRSLWSYASLGARPLAKPSVYQRLSTNSEVLIWVETCRFENSELAVRAVEHFRRTLTVLHLEGTPGGAKIGERCWYYQDPGGLSLLFQDGPFCVEIHGRPAVSADMMQMAAKISEKISELGGPEQEVPTSNILEEQRARYFFVSLADKVPVRQGFALAPGEDLAGFTVTSRQSSPNLGDIQGVRYRLSKGTESCWVWVRTFKTVKQAEDDTLLHLPRYGRTAQVGCTFTGRSIGDRTFSISPGTIGVLKNNVRIVVSRATSGFEDGQMDNVAAILVQRVEDSPALPMGQELELPRIAELALERQEAQPMEPIQLTLRVDCRTSYDVDMGKGPFWEADPQRPGQYLVSWPVPGDYTLTCTVISAEGVVVEAPPLKVYIRER